MLNNLFTEFQYGPKDLSERASDFCLSPLRFSFAEHNKSEGINRLIGKIACILFCNLHKTFCACVTLIGVGLSLYSQTRAEKVKVLTTCRKQVADGREALAKVDTAKAARIFRQVIKTAPHFAQAHTFLGEALLGQGKEREAVEVFNRALLHNPNDPLALARKGEILFRQGNRETAKELLEKAYQIAPHNAFVSGRVGALFIREGRLEEGEKLLRESLDSNPKDLFVIETLGVHYRNVSKPEKAVEVFDRAAETGLQTPGLKKNHLRALRSAGLTDRAKEFEETLDDVGSDADEYLPHHLPCSRRLLSDNEEEGEDDFQEPTLQLLRDARFHIGEDAYFGKLVVAGEEALEKEDFGFAKSCFETILKEYHEDFDASIGLVKTLIAQEDYRNAKIQLNKISRYDNPKNYLQPLIDLMRDSSDVSAEYYYQAIIAIDPTNFTLRKEYFELLVKLGKVDDAINLCNAGLDLDEEDKVMEAFVLFLTKNGNSFNGANQYESALKLFNALIKSGEISEDIYFGRATALHKLKRSNEAEKDLRTLLKLVPNHHAAQNLLHEVESETQDSGDDVVLVNDIDSDNED